MSEHPAWRSPLSAIRDRISFSSSAARLREPSFRIVDALQFSDPAVQLDALFVSAVAMATVVGLDPVLGPSLGHDRLRKGGAQVRPIRAVSQNAHGQAQDVLILAFLCGRRWSEAVVHNLSTGALTTVPIDTLRVVP
jgi:hypothetical protein